MIQHTYMSNISSWITIDTYQHKQLAVCRVVFSWVPYTLSSRHSIHKQFFSPSKQNGWIHRQSVECRIHQHWPIASTYYISVISQSSPLSCWLPSPSMQKPNVAIATAAQSVLFSFILVLMVYWDRMGIKHLFMCIYTFI